MKSWVKSIIAFAAGAIVGGIAVKKYIDYKNENAEHEELIPYDQLQAEQKIEKEEIETNMENDNGPTGWEPFAEEKHTIPSKEEYERLLEDLKYRAAQEAEEIEHQFDIPEDTSKPYPIDACEFEALDDYESDDYTYYADGWVTDSYGLPVAKEDVENTLGDTLDKMFWDPSINEMWVRNERLKMDFSIVRDIDRLEDVANPRVRKLMGID